MERIQNTNREEQLRTKNVRFTYGGEYVNTSMLSPEEEQSVKQYLQETNPPSPLHSSLTHRPTSISECRLGHQNLQLSNHLGTLLPLKLKDRLPFFINRHSPSKAQKYFMKCKIKLYNRANGPHLLENEVELSQRA